MSQAIDLCEKFPDLTPITRPPKLFRVNGCGTALYGRRNLDTETQSYVKTLCLAILFVPVLALRAYRVVDAGEGWHFLGRQPLSRLARRWNSCALVLAVVLSAAGLWRSYYGSETYRAARKLATADEHLAAGRLGEAARLYGELVSEDTPERLAAQGRFEQLAGAPLRRAPLDEAAAVARAGVEVRRSMGSPACTRALYESCLELAGKHAASQPAGAFALVDSAGALAPEDGDRAGERRLLETLVQGLPDDPRPASRLAELHEQGGELERCAALLAPHARRLGDLEGARILGQILAREQRFDESCALLASYVERRLPALHAAEAAFERAYTTAQDAALEQLNDDSSFRSRFENASEARQQAMVEERIAAHLRDDRALARAQETLQEAGAVVPAALDLGVARLRRAQGLEDPAARRAELERAEKTFLSVQGQASESEEFKLYLGQVYYWLGKHAEGRGLFDELLEADQRGFTSLMAVASALREVGATAEARALAEEAFEQRTTEEEGSDAALLRSLIEIDLDDRIAWLHKCDPELTVVKAQLADALGLQALAAGNDQEAARRLREAIAIYDSLPESPASLNNASSALMTLFSLTGRLADLEASLLRQEKALALEPTDSILLMNCAHVAEARAVHGLVEGALDLGALRTVPSLEHLRFLYEDEDGKDALIARVRSDAGFRKAASYMNQATVLAPRDPNAQGWLLAFHGFQRDVEALREADQRLQGIEPDLADRNRETLEFLQGSMDDLSEARARLERHEETLARVRDSGGATFAAAAADVAAARMGLDRFGLETDTDEIVRLAEEARAAAACAATRDILIAALSLRAVETLAAEHPEIHELRERVRRALAPLYLVIHALAPQSPLRAAAAENADVVRVLALTREGLERFPDRAAPRDWALFRAVEPSLAEELAPRVREDRPGQLERSLYRRLAPLDAGAALEACWELQLAGKDGEARALLRACAERGVPLPDAP